MAIMDWRSKQILNPFFRLEGHVGFDEDQLALEFQVKDAEEKMVITMVPEEIKSLAEILDDFAKRMVKEIEELEKGGGGLDLT